MQGPETRLLEAARRARQTKLSLSDQGKLDSLITALERVLETPAERQTRIITTAPPAPVTQGPSHSGQLPSAKPEFANAR